MTELLVHVLGTPAPAGSKTFKGMRNGHAILAESSKSVKPWRRDVEQAAGRAIRLWCASEPEREGMWLPLDGPILLDVIFMLRAPKTMPRGRTAPTTYPDLSKLIRSTEDALVRAEVMRDDARIVRLTAEKRYAEPGQPTGARIRVAAMSSQGALI